jgi:diamine N-acetyltransferase
MFIKSQHIYLRALETSDLDLIFALENDMSIWKISNTITPFSKDIIQLYLQSAQQDIYTNKQLRLLICLNESNQPVGTIDLFEFDPMNLRVGVGILIFESHRNSGYAAESITVIKNYSKNVLLLNQLYCNINASNKDSIKLFEKCSFEKIGLKKQWNRVSLNQFEDEIIYQLIL